MFPLLSSLAVLCYVLAGVFLNEARRPHGIPFYARVPVCWALCVFLLTCGVLLHVGSFSHF